MIEKPKPPPKPDPQPWKMNPDFETILMGMSKEKLIDLIMIMGEHNLAVYDKMKETQRLIDDKIDPKH